MSEDENGEAVAGTLAAYGFILENLYALLLGGDAKPIAACRATAQAMLTDFDGLRPTGGDPAEIEEAQRILQHGYLRLESFWANVEGRLVPLDKPSSGAALG